MARAKRPRFRINDRVTLASHTPLIPAYGGKPFVGRDTILRVSSIVGKGTLSDPWEINFTDDAGHFWRMRPGDLVLAEGEGRHHATKKKSSAQLQREIDESLAKPLTTSAASGVPSALTLWEGEHSDVPLHPKYWYAVDQGTYHITPVRNPDQPRDIRYDLRFNKKPLGWEKIGPYHKTLKKAVSAAQRHYADLGR